MLAATRSFRNYRAGQMTEQYIRIEAEVCQRLMTLEASVPGDVIVVPLSMGNLYAGYSQRNAHQTALNASHLPLGSAHVGSSLLLMSERLTAYGQL